MVTTSVSALVVEHPLERRGRRSATMPSKPRSNARANASRSLLGVRLAQDAAAHHRRQRQRQDRRDADGDRQRDRELAEQAADEPAHEQQRDQHRDQRDRQRHDGEADLLGALERGLERRLALLDVARDVLDHHDRVVDDEAGRDGERHQRQVVEAVAAAGTSRRRCAISDSGTATPGMIVARRLRRKR